MIPYTPTDVLFSVFGYGVGPHFLGLVVAFTIYLYLVCKKLNKERLFLKFQSFFDLSLILIVTTLLGGRIWHYLLNKSFFWDFFRMDGMGLTSFGMILGGGVGALLYYVIQKKFRFEMLIMEGPRVIDVFALYAGIWIFLYRITGCFLENDVLGIETKLFFGIRAEDNLVRFPTSILLGLSGLMIFLILFYFFRNDKLIPSKRGKSFDGEIAIWFLILYGGARFAIEFLREEDSLFLFSISQLGALGICLIGVLLYSWSIFIIKKDNLDTLRKFRQSKLDKLKQDPTDFNLK